MGSECCTREQAGCGTRLQTGSLAAGSASSRFQKKAGDVVFELLLIDMAGIVDEARAPAVLKIIRDHLRLPRVHIDLVYEEFFERTASGRVDPATVEQALNEVEEYIWEGWQGEFALDDFLVLFLVDQGTSARFLMQILREIMQRTTMLPVVLALAVGEAGDGQITVLERADLPLAWRCVPGDSVVLNEDVWLDGEDLVVGADPLLLQGTPLTVVERAAYDGDQLNGDYLLALLEEQDPPIIIALPWSLVTHPSEWEKIPRGLAKMRVVATYRLPGWFSVRIETSSRLNATASEQGERSP